MSEQNTNVPAVDHIAIAVPDLAVACQQWSKLLGINLDAIAIHEVAAEKVRIGLIELANVHLELLEPLTDDSPIANFLEKNPKGGLHHLCLKTDDIDADCARVQSLGFSTLNPEPKSTAPGVRILFLHPKSTTGVLTEMREVKGKGY